MKQFCKIVVGLITVVVFTACNEAEKKQEIVQVAESEYPIISSKDDFEDDFAQFWRFQRVSEDRIAITEDPQNKDNQVMKVTLKPDDRNRGGNRSELVIAGHDSLGYKTAYSFKFMLPKSFFKTEQRNNWYMIHQWHDEPQYGYTWQTNKHKTKPPASLIVQYTVENGYRLNYVTGLQTGNLKEARIISWPEALQPETWYEFSNEIFWSVYDTDGYSKPHLNGQAFNTDTNADGKVYGRNMYNTRGSFYKYGLYSSGRQVHERHLYFDDFKMESQRLGYGLVKH